MIKPKQLEDVEQNKSAIKSVELIELPKDSILPIGFKFIYLSILSDVFSSFVCLNCFITNTCKLLDIEDKKGLARFMQINCRDCEFKRSFYISRQIDSTKDNRSRGMKIMEITVRAVNVLRSIGVRHTPLTKLCGFLNMPPPMTKNAFDDLSYLIKVASKEVAEKSMSDANSRLRRTEKSADIGVSVDDTWQGKGFSPTLGVVTAAHIDNEKVLNVAILSKSCKGCTSMKKIIFRSCSLYRFFPWNGNNRSY